MQRLRLLVVVLATLVVSLAGVPVAAADHHRDDDEPKIIRVGNVRADEDHPKHVWVRVVYKCDSRSEEGTIEVTLRQRSKDGDRDKDDKHFKARYEGEADAVCDGERRREWVELERVRREDGKRLGYVHDGWANLHVTLTEDKGDDVSERFTVRVRGAGDHDDDKD